MARKKTLPATSCTDTSSSAATPPPRFTMSLDRIEGLGERLAEAFRVADAAAMVALLTDPRFVSERLAKASPIALGILEILVDFEGLLHRDALDRVVIQRFGVSQRDVEQAVESVFGTGLAAAIVAQMPYESHKQRFAMLLAESSPAVAAAVRGLSLPRSTPEVSLAAASRRALRDHVAFLAALAHVTVRATTADLANRASTKKLGALAELDARSAADRVDDAVFAGLVGVRGERLVPRVDALRALAAGGAAPADADQEWVAARIPRDRWISLEALTRELARVEHVRTNAPYFERFGVALAQTLPTYPRLESMLRARAWLTLADHDGALWVRRWPEGGSGSGDGHVTPAFEVMLGPDADPQITLDIALAAEPVRFDTVLTFKLTPASIGSALSLGLDTTRILAALDRVGRHPVPDNVRHMVLDWSRTSRTATVRKAWVIETNGTEAAEAAARALGARVIARPTPTTLLVDEALANPAAMLGKCGVHIDAEIVRSMYAPRAREAEDVPLAIHTPSPQLVTRLADARAEKGGLAIPAAQPAASRAQHVVRSTTPEGLGERDELDRILAETSDDEYDDERSPGEVLGGLLERLDEDSELFDTIDRLADRWFDLEDAFIDWAGRRGGRICDDALDRASREPWAFLPLLVLKPAVQRRLLRDARSTDEMITSARRLVVAGDGVEDAELFERATGAEAQKAFGIASSDAHASAPDASASAEKGVNTPDAIRETFARAIERGASVTLRVHSKTQGERKLRLRAERVLVRGADVTLLGTELQTELARSFPLANVRELVLETS